MRKVVQAPARRTQDPTWARPSQTFLINKIFPVVLSSRLVFCCSALRAARKASKGVVVVGLNFVIGQDGRRSAKGEMGSLKGTEGELHR